MVDTQVEDTNNLFILPSKNSFLFSKKKEYDNILKKWQDAFSNNQKRGQLFLDFKDDKKKVLKPTYANESL